MHCIYLILSIDKTMCTENVLCFNIERVVCTLTTIKHLVHGFANFMRMSVYVNTFHSCAFIRKDRCVVDLSVAENKFCEYSDLRTDTHRYRRTFNNNKYFLSI